MKVIEGHHSEESDILAEENFCEKSIVFTDKSTGYEDIGKYVETHITEVSDNKTTKTTLQWVHFAISNAKRALLGKLNRIYFGERLFERLKLAVAKNYG